MNGTFGSQSFARLCCQVGAMHAQSLPPHFGVFFPPRDGLFLYLLHLNGSPNPYSCQGSMARDQWLWGALPSPALNPRGLAPRRSRRLQCIACSFPRKGSHPPLPVLEQGNIVTRNNTAFKTHITAACACSGCSHPPPSPWSVSMETAAKQGSQTE